MIGADKFYLWPVRSYAYNLPLLRWKIIIPFNWCGKLCRMKRFCPRAWSGRLWWIRLIIYGHSNLNLDDKYIIFIFRCMVGWKTCADKDAKYKICVCDTKLAELNDNLIHSYACALSNYQCIFDPLTDAIMIASFRVFRNVVLDYNINFPKFLFKIILFQKNVIVVNLKVDRIIDCRT
jgi:hypothetical protein